MFVRLRAFVRRVGTFASRRRAEARLHDELQLHADLVAAEHLKHGASPEEARRQARLAVGGLAQLREEYRDALGFRPFDDLGRDLRLAVRSLRRNPGFTCLAVTVLALGIGAATAVFSVVDAVVLRALPFDDPGRLVAVLEYDTRDTAIHNDGRTTSQSYLDWRAQQRVFEKLAAVSETSLALRDAEGHPQVLRAARVTAEFFTVLRGVPLLGRTFDTSDEVRGRHRVAILSDGFWRRHFGGSRSAIGTVLTLDDEPWEVVGVMPRRFSYPVGAVSPADIFVPLAFRDEERVRTGPVGPPALLVLGRLRPGVSLASASDEMTRLSASLRALYPDWLPSRRPRVLPLKDHLVGGVRAGMQMLLGTVAIVLLIACVNVANLTLARMTVRRPELATRVALGASRAAIVRAALIEAMVLSLGGAAVGVLLAWGLVHGIRAWLPAELPRVAAVAIDMRVLGASIAAAVLAGLAVGIVPALQASRPCLPAVLAAAGRRVTTDTGAHRFRAALVVAEVALTLVLLAGAGLFVGSFASVVQIDSGFDHRNVLAVDIDLARQPADVHARTAHVARIVDAVGRVPGVMAAAAVTLGVPLKGDDASSRVVLPGGRQFSTESDRTNWRRVTPGYLELLRVPLVRGRHLTDRDRGDTEPVVVVNEAAAQKYWPGQDPLGQRAVVGGGPERLVVGIVGNIRDRGPEIPPRQECYVPLAQSQVVRETTLVVRTAGDPLDALHAVRRAIWSVDKDQRIRGNLFTLDAFMDRLIAARRMMMTLFVLYAGLGLAIAAAGIYGVIAYLVARRTGEIGVRMALGATPGGVVAMVLRQAALLIGSGLALGCLAAWGFGAVARRFLFGIDAHDLRVYVAAGIVLALSGLAAAVAPARRAAAVDPIAALRNE